MVWKTILTAAFLFIIYTVILIYLAPNSWHTSQHQWQGNVVKAQNFLYDDSSSYQNVIVGSSLSSTLILDSLPETFNLSFGGQSVFDGLFILSQKGKLPEYIFIEMNVILRGENKDLTSSLVSPMLYYPKKVLPSLREDRQPIALLGAQINSKITKPILDKFKFWLFVSGEAETKFTNNTKLSYDDVFFSKMLNLQIINYSEIPTKDEIKNSFGNLKKYVSGFESKGVKVIFFEMPVNNKLENLPKAAIVRKNFQKYFPETQFEYILKPKSIEFKTTDGVHLSYAEALKYTHFLKSKLTFGN